MAEHIIHTARARATVVLEFDVGGGGWGHTCALEQVYSQAESNARGEISAAINGNLRGAKIVSVGITAILVPNERYRG